MAGRVMTLLRAVAEIDVSACSIARAFVGIGGENGLLYDGHLESSGKF